MPNFEVHKKAGFIFSIIFTIIFSILFYSKYPFLDWKLLLAPAVIYVYSNFPDYDHHLGKLRRYTFTAIFIVLAASSILLSFIGIQYAIVVFTIIGILGFVLLKLRHRGPMHSYLFTIIAPLPLLFVHWFLFLIGFVAIFSHIFIDRLWSGTKRKAAKFFHWKTSQHTTINIFSR